MPPRNILKSQRLPIFPMSRNILRCAHWLKRSPAPESADQPRHWDEYRQRNIAVQPDDSYSCYDLLWSDQVVRWRFLTSPGRQDDITSQPSHSGSSRVRASDISFCALYRVIYGLSRVAYTQRFCRFSSSEWRDGESARRWLGASGTGTHSAGEELTQYKTGESIFSWQCCQECYSLTQSKISGNMASLSQSVVVLLAITASSLAYPGMGRTLRDLEKHLARAPAGFLGSTAMLGDLNSLPDSQLSASGAAIKAILSGDGQPLNEGGIVYTAPGPLDSAACAADRCCVYKYAALDMAATFKDPATGECTRLARAALRLGFHDAGTWETSMGYETGGGADGSILLSGTEMERPDNRGVVGIANETLQWYSTYNRYGAGMADLIQLGAMTAVVSCPGGPRMRFFAGRRDSAVAASDGLIPQPTQGADFLIDLFQRKSFSPGGLAVLLGAHTVSQQFFTAPALPGASQDSTPGVWDNGFYNVTIAAAAPAGVLRFQSDLALSRHQSTGEVFQFFATPAGRIVWQQVSYPTLLFGCFGRN
jgi:manganese peroxidase